MPEAELEKTSATLAMLLLYGLYELLMLLFFRKLNLLARAFTFATSSYLAFLALLHIVAFGPGKERWLKATPLWLICFFTPPYGARLFSADEQMRGNNSQRQGIIG